MIKAVPAPYCPLPSAKLSQPFTLRSTPFSPGVFESDHTSYLLSIELYSVPFSFPSDLLRDENVFTTFVAWFSTTPFHVGLLICWYKLSQSDYRLWNGDLYFLPLLFSRGPSTPS